MSVEETNLFLQAVGRENIQLATEAYRIDGACQDRECTVSAIFADLDDDEVISAAKVLARIDLTNYSS